MKRALFPLLIALALSSAACIPNRGYRTTIGPCPTVNGAIPSACSIQDVQSLVGGQKVEIPIAFVEFDDVGQAFNIAQVKAAEDTIGAAQSAARTTGETPVVVLFLHGWKNNASDSSGNVPGFRRVLQQLQSGLPGARLVGIYFGWRGGTTGLPVVKEFTYWNRRDTATYIPGSNMSEALLRIARKAKVDNDPSQNAKLIVVGHSFGGLVLERTVTQTLTRRVVETPPGGKLQPFADLLVFVNEAAAATEGIQLLTMLHDHADVQEYPTIVSITSQGDLATRFVLPVGQGASLIKKSLRNYGAPYAADPFGITNQRTYYLRSATHIPELQSHVVSTGDDIKAAYISRGYTCAKIQNTNYYVVPIASAKNTTPYWVMQMPVEIVPDHSNIFRVEFGLLLQAFLLRQSTDQRPDANTCYSGPAPLPNVRAMKSGFALK
jgi:pimeloyl-ACP methyl ester carboxylesterase